jgi:hypothetical protein
MASKQRVFAHSGDINYNDYIKNKIGIETFKNIKSSQNHHNVNNNIIKKFKNHSDLINFTKTYYYNLNNYSLHATKDLYNSNNSVVDNKILHNYDNSVDNNGNGDNNDDKNCKNNFNECLELSQVLYPYGVYGSTTPKIYMHFNLDLNKWCIKKSLVDYNSIYNLDNIDINIDGYNVCNNDGSCYKVGSKLNNSNDNNHDNDDTNDNCDCKKTKCKTGLCKNAKPLFIHL